MITGKFLKQLSIVSALLLLLSTSFAAANFNIGTLSKAFSKKRNVRVSYVQRRLLSFSGRPIISSGHLVYKAPDYFAQIELSPVKRTLIARSGWLMVVENKRVQRRIKLSTWPNMQVQIGTLKSVLSGKFYNLQSAFNLSLQGNQQSWILNLTPKKTLQKSEKSSVGNIKAIQIYGQQAGIRTLLLRYSNGNITTLSLARSD